MTEYKGYYQVSIDDFDLEHHVKLPWQLVIDSWFSKLNSEDKEFLVEECEYILELIKKEKENG